MNALRVLASPRIWISIVGVVLALALIFYAYLAAVASPEEDLKDLPVALVNEDKGGEQVTLGDQVVENVTGPDSPAGDVVEWAQLDGRQKATEGLGRNEYYGAIVIPEDYLDSIGRCNRTVWRCWYEQAEGMVNSADGASCTAVAGSSWCER